MYAESKTQVAGIVRSVMVARGFGFLEPTAGGPQVFFHASDLLGLDFDEQLRERRVTYTLQQTPKGSRAKSVRAAE